jgi:aspartate/methionine/tyrosine aminotransferase
MAPLFDHTDDVDPAFDLALADVATVPGTAREPRGTARLRFSCGHQPPARIREAAERLRILGAGDVPRDEA